MRKYLQVLKITFQQELAYRLNFIMWRVRNVMQVFLMFFLWDSVFSDSSRQFFGYNRSKMLTYIFGILIIKAIVFSSRTIELSGIISDGTLAQYLLKPINFFKYWFTADIASKILNLSFSFVETILLFLIFKPEIYFQSNPIYLLLFFISLLIAVLLFFAIVFLINMVSFWTPEAGWALPFLFIVIIGDFLSGSVFPLDIFSKSYQNIFYSLPFPYLVFFPLQIYLGKLPISVVINGIFISLGWLIILWFSMKYVWQRGLKKFSSEGI